MEPVLHRDADSGHAYVTKGPILYSLPVSGEWKKVVDRGRFSDWEVHPREEWAYALVVGESREMSATRNGEWQGLFGPNDPPDWINVVAKPVTNWRMYHNSAGPIPDTPDCASELRTVRLIPYAASDLRLSLFPTC